MARYKYRWFDKLGTLFIVCIQAVPAAVYFLYIQLYGTQALGVGLLFQIDDPKYWILPVVSMSLNNIAFYGMWLRRYMVDESNKDYVKLARAKGMSEGGVMFPKRLCSAGPVHTDRIFKPAHRPHLYRILIQHSGNGRPAGHGD